MADYDVPNETFKKKRSAAFQHFYHHWFEEPLGLLRHEVDTSFLHELTDEERILARELLRRNLNTGESHIIEGVALLGDRASIPILKEMLGNTVDASRRLVISGSLWKLDLDESFPKEIELMVRHGRGILKQAHLEQIEWLRDSRTIKYLIEILDEGDTFASSLALSRLNEIEDNKRYLIGRDDFLHTREYYLDRMDDEAFVQSMTERLNNYDPSTFDIATSGGIVSYQIERDIR